MSIEDAAREAAQEILDAVSYESGLDPLTEVLVKFAHEIMKRSRVVFSDPMD